MIEAFIFGMFDGTIIFMKSPGVNGLVSSQNQMFIRNLPIGESGKYLWLPTEQVVAYPTIKKVADNNGRDFIQNQTLLVPIHDYLRITNANQTLSKYLVQTNPLPNRLESQV